MNPSDLIPQPRAWRSDGGFMPLSGRLEVSGPPAFAPACDYLRRNLKEKPSASGEPLPLEIRPLPNGAPEEYRLSIRPDGIDLEGTPAGALYGAVTLCRLLKNGDGSFKDGIETGEIHDAPSLPFRGLLLDCSRHFLPVAYLKHAVDTLLELKLNTLHLHLTDDQGWRVEIDAYPELTRRGSRIKTGPDCEGYYSKRELRDLVAYAKARGVEVVPEIELPGHSFAAVTCYPDLCCTRRPMHNEGHMKDIYCAGREETFTFLQAVLEEVLDIFPSPYIHLGGDEAPKDRWRECPDCQTRIRTEGLSGEEELQSYLFKRMADFLKSRGRNVIGWDEILDGVPSPEIVVQWWRYRRIGDVLLKKALEAGRRVIASPNCFTYLSFPVDPNASFAFERTSDLEQVYSAPWLPTDWPPEKRSLLFGAECCVWTEGLTSREIDRMLFPRIFACAELMWATPARRNFGEFHRRVEQDRPQWKARGIEYGPAFRAGPSAVSGAATGAR